MDRACRAAVVACALFGASASVLACAPLAISASAEKASDTSRWRFLPEVGIDGMASIWGDNFSQMGIECGNGGGPVISLGPVPRPAASGSGPETVPLDFDIDGAKIRENFECYPGEDSCTSTTFAPNVLIAALKAGKRARIFIEGEPLFDFTLAGSGAAISRLVNCGG